MSKLGHICLMTSNPIPYRETGLTKKNHCMSLNHNFNALISLMHFSRKKSFPEGEKVRPKDRNGFKQIQKYRHDLCFIFGVYVHEEKESQMECLYIDLLEKTSFWKTWLC